jgi:hypothetical protein
MKKVIYFLLAFCLFFASCEKDESLDPRPDLVAGKYVLLNVKSGYINFNEISSSAFTAELTDPSNSIVKYELFIRRRTPNGIITSDFVLFKTITSFPFQLSISAQEISDVLGVPISSLEDGDNYQFSAFSYDSNGVKSGFLNLSTVVQSVASMKQGYKFSTLLTDDPALGLDFNNYAPFTDN